jgi:hypothetical protein
MDMQIVYTVLRQILIALGAFLVTKGLIADDLVEPIVGGVLALSAAAFGIFAKKKDQDALKPLK